MDTDIGVDSGRGLIVYRVPSLDTLVGYHQIGPSSSSTETGFSIFREY